MKDYYTMKFKIEPDLNEGYVTVFKQDKEDWWWYKSLEDEGYITGGTPNLKNAIFEGLYLNGEKLY